ncbi:MAG: hypothetical protein JSV91_04355 [Phycisphaerales bacterium]|nr:MAG: hypothetical protein JSV91_04355 [Phycisphaerales bacterium]
MTNRNLINLRISKHPVWLWIAAVIITLATAMYQRMTGPTYPIRGSVQFNGGEVSFRLLRSEDVGTDAPVSIKAPDSSLAGYVEYGNYMTGDTWETIQLQRMDLVRDGEKLTARLPTQAAARKLMYKVFVQADGQSRSLTDGEPIIIRYKGPVPAWVLAPHILFMFMSMLWSTRAFLEALDAEGRPFKLMIHTMWMLLIGGLIFGPIVQKYAFGVYWDVTDFTDNKTAIAMFGWILALIANWKNRTRRGWIIFAAILMFAIFTIPHSILGSEAAYTRVPQVPPAGG